MLYRLAGLCLSRPRAALLLGVLVTLLCASGLPKLQLRTDGQAIYPLENPIVEQSKLDEETFRDPQQAIVLISARPGGPPVASAAGFRFLNEADGDLRSLPAVESRGVRSLANLVDPDPHLSSVQSAQGYLDDLPSSAAEVSALRAKIRRHPLAEGLFLSPDGSAAAVYVPLSEDLSRTEAVADLERWAETQSGSAFDVRLTGPVVAEVELGRKVFRDIAWTTPLMLLAMILLLWRCLRTPGAVVVVLAAQLVVLVCTLGVMGHAGMPVTLVTTILPIILLVMAVADEIHFLERLQADRTRVEAALREVGKPLVLTSLTTAAAFLAFPASGIPPLRDFGLLAAGGILLAMLSSFTLIPALVVSLPASWWRSAQRKATPAASPLPPFEGWISRHPRAAFGVGLALLICVIPGIFLMTVQDSWIDNFEEDSPVVSAHQEINERFWGTYRFDVVVSSDEPQFFRRPEGLKLVEEVSRLASSAPQTGGVVTHLTPLGILSEIAGKSQDVTRLPPDELRTVLALGVLLRSRLDLDQLVTRDAQQARLRILVKSADYQRGLDLRDFLGQGLAPMLAGRGVKAHFSGDLPLAVEVVRAVVLNQLSSIGWSLAAIALILGLALRSAVRAFIILVPVIAAAGLVFGIVGYAGLPLGIASSMFLALSVGAGTDFALHLFHAYRDAWRAGADHAAAVGRSLATAGRAVRWNALVLGLGFLTLSFSSLKPNRTLGLLLGAAMFAAYLMTLLLLPRLLRWFASEKRSPTLVMDFPSFSPVERRLR